MRAAAIAVVAMLGACGEAQRPAAVAPAVSGPEAPPAAGQGSAVPEATQEARLAAIQKAMNELDEGAQACWAAAAVVRFDIEGELAANIEIEPAAARVAIARDTTRNAQLAGCVQQLLAGYRWAPPLHGQAIQLPFRFRAPDGQSVIDRRLVPWQKQGPVAVAVLLDESNSGNGAASMFELAIAAGGATGPRIAERAELWYFLHAGTVTGVRVLAGDMMYVPAGAVRDVRAAGELHAVVVIAPGGREGAARAGALPTPESASARGRTSPVHMPAARARAYPRPAGKVTLFAEPSTIKDKGLAASVIELPAGAAIPEHVHALETELLYVLAGAGTLTVAGVAVAVGPTSVVQIPPNTPHAFAATDDFRAVQIYAPAGPEQRFKPAAAPKTKPKAAP